MLPVFRPLVAGAMLPILLLLVPPFAPVSYTHLRAHETGRNLVCRLLRYGEGKCCPFFSRWRRRYAAHFTAVSAAFNTTARVNAARFSPFWCRHYVDHFTAVGAAFYTTARVNAARFLPVGVGVVLPILLLLLPPFTLRRG